MDLIEKISFTERVFLEVLVGERIKVDGVIETIVDVQFEPQTRQLLLCILEQWLILRILTTSGLKIPEKSI